MSRAFTREEDSENAIAGIGERPISPHRNLVTERGLAQIEANSRRFAGRYTSDPREAGHLSSVGVNAPIVTLVDTGWTAVVTHQGADGFACAIGVHAKNPLSGRAKSGEIVCK